MKKFLMMLMVVLASSVMFITDSAEAARIGGGRSVGRQNSTIQRTAPAQQNNAMANNRQQQAAQANNGRRPGFGMGLLGGLAAGLGLSALASAFGLGEGSGIFLLMLLLAGLAFVAFRMFGKRLQQQQQTQAAGSGAPFAGNLRDAFNSNKPGQSDMFRQNSNAGGLFSQPPAAGAAQAPVAAADTGVSGYTAAMQVPGGFDTEAFVRQAKVQFVRLQAAFDARNADDLREFTSPEMFGELNIDMMQRGSAPQTTEVVELNAELTGMHQEGPILVASVLFSGLIREEPNSPAEPFSEIWNFTRPASGASGWVLAGIQQPN
ncbi:Tim44 domain-containing protein [Lautropia mirabilis]|uniref:Tim44 domain-containing protein n=1 Tax=Lautropia mirabilis TaxID=47671 RepID=UPI0028EBACAA|nr:TIM44-like domain-containing protein [Lautropia mirabilis]